MCAVGPVLEDFERIPSCSHGLETQRPWAFNDAPVSNAICVHVVLALHPGQSRSPKVPGRTRTVAVRKKTIRKCPLEVRSVSLVSTSFTCMNACLWL